VERSRRRSFSCKEIDRKPDAQSHQERPPGIRRLRILNAARPSRCGAVRVSHDLEPGRSGAPRFGLPSWLRPHVNLLDGLYHLLRYRVVNHVPNTDDDLQGAIWDRPSQPLGLVRTNDCASVRCSAAGHYRPRGRHRWVDASAQLNARRHRSRAPAQRALPRWREKDMSRTAGPGCCR
jgi:hypothetical protein